MCEALACASRATARSGAGPTGRAGSYSACTRGVNGLNGRLNAQSRGEREWMWQRRRSRVEREPPRIGYCTGQRLRRIRRTDVRQVEHAGDVSFLGRLGYFGYKHRRIASGFVRHAGVVVMWYGGRAVLVAACNVAPAVVRVAFVAVRMNLIRCGALDARDRQSLCRVTRRPVTCASGVRRLVSGAYRTSRRTEREHPRKRAAGDAPPVGVAGDHEDSGGALWLTRLLDAAHVSRQQAPRC